MICQPCQFAGDYNTREHFDTATKNHNNCHGKNHCDCQHKVGPSHQFIDETKVNKANGNEED